MDKEKKFLVDTNKDSIMEGQGRIVTDPFGSYTGISTDDCMELPVQDVDDL